MGGRWITSLEALARFADKQTPKLDAPRSLPRTPERRKRASAQAGEKLGKIGI
jgi:hypothetical protein